MPFNASMSGIFGPTSRRNTLVANDLYKPSGTSRVLGLSFNQSLTTTSADSTLSVTVSGTTPTLNSSGGISGGFASNFQPPASVGSTNTGSSLFINSLPLLDTSVNYTFIAWFKGDQTVNNSSGSWQPATPVFGDPRGTVYFGLGIDRGRVAFGDRSVMAGIKNISDNSWHMLCWTVDSSLRVNAWVDGYQELFNYRRTGSTSTSRADYIGQGYPYVSSSPSALDGIQIYNQILTDSQIKEIYQGVTGLTPTPSYVSARYWRARYGSVTTGGHHPRVSRVILKDLSGATYNVAVFTSDNLSDSGTIPNTGSSWTYDAGSGNTKTMIGAGYYVTYNAPSDPRAGFLHLDYSNNGSTWFEYAYNNIVTARGGGIYYTDGTTP